MNLSGTNGESISIEVESFESPVAGATVVWLAVSLNISCAHVCFKQACRTVTYDFPPTPEIESLIVQPELVDFHLNAHDFFLDICRCRRKNNLFLIEGAITSVRESSFYPWPKQKSIEAVLKDESPAGCLRFAFYCNSENLKNFGILVLSQSETIDKKLKE